ncbi:hypothetical protein NDU68_004636 [Salmonella enterica]|nr:hypothetical protein [Salmonella enterica]HEJ9060784.1 hypothetical protein [Serratia fonticola]EBI1134267.1 hypothetical protein [Salmonella enterica]ECQ8080039.1 hypothetical protein [Salmonella enterica]EJA7008777.1 hypothetical protein [Salmonella enterica]
MNILATKERLGVNFYLVEELTCVGDELIVNFINCFMIISNKKFFHHKQDGVKVSYIDKKTYDINVDPLKLDFERAEMIADFMTDILI